MAGDDRVCSVIALLDPPAPCHARHYRPKGLALCASILDWHVHRGEHDSIDRRIHICGGGKRKATAGTLWGVWSICSSVWALQHCLGCWLHRWTYLGGLHPGQSWLVYCHLDSRGAERSECASNHALHGRPHIKETLAYVDSSSTISNRIAS